MTAASDIRFCLTQCRTIAVVGLSPKTHRDSHEVALYMQRHGFRIIPVNPAAQEILGERCYPSLIEAARHERIDLVNAFRNAADIPPIAEEARAIGAKALWLQLGIVHDDAAEAARAAGLVVVQDRCLKIEHARLRA
jgi:predicted CoA-binding protein